MKNKKSLDEGLIDLYIHLKKENMLDEYDQYKLKTQKEKLKRINSFTIIDYIKTTFEIVSDLKAKNQIELFLTQSDLILKTNLEELLREAENKIRKLFRIQIKYRINNETLRHRIEELEKSNIELKKNLKLREEVRDEKKEKEIKDLRTEIENQKMILTSYQNLNSKLSELEVKLRSQNIKHEKEMKSMEMRYRQRIFELGKIISRHEEMLKNSNSSNVNLNNPNITTNSNIISTTQGIINQNTSGSLPLNLTPFDNKDKDLTNRLNSSTTSLGNPLRNSFSNSINKSSSYIEEEEEISQINYSNRQNSKEPSNSCGASSNNKTLNVIKISHTPSQSMGINNIPRPNKELLDIPKSPTKNSVSPSNLTQINSIIHNSASISNNEIHISNFPIENGQINGNVNSNEIAEINSNCKNSNELIKSNSEIQFRSKHRINKLFYKKKNSMVQSAEFNMSLIKEQLNTPSNEKIEPKINNDKFSSKLSRTQSQKELNESDLKENNPIELLDETDLKNEIFSLSSDNWNKSSRLSSRKNSSSSLLANDISMLKNSLYRRNNEPSSKALLLARLSRSKKNPSSKVKNINTNTQTNLLEIEQHLNKIKSPIKKAKSSKVFKNK